MKTFSLHSVIAASTVAAAVMFSSDAMAQTLNTSLLYQQGSCPWGNWNGNYATTKYPVVLVSGVTGAPTWPAPGSGYFYNIPQDLCGNGATVYVADLPAVNTEEVRGPILV